MHGHNIYIYTHTHIFNKVDKEAYPSKESKRSGKSQKGKNPH